ncbi:SpoIIE family protein phosphatase [Streptomyces sp. BH-SS-21]|uniref:SpoIIE family protein phosphatase n=1 Tax=Streptomyces liliiviolaceus TaxID=2823109 RepID=A0A940XZ02_9ACTN|nr:SpoIIE family protein phosphatase [Streptomyces liliiviolaceus]MBQ0850282.1 SpoIIE family protein phosphatase [Streptomyces liliiviolaceus]
MSVLAWLTVALGVLGLSGWVLPAQVLRDAWPGPDGWIKANTSLALTLLGIGLTRLVGRSSGPLHISLSRAAAVSGALIGIASLLEYVSGGCFGIDQLLFRDDTTDDLPQVASPPGRMAPNTAVALILAGAAQFMLSLPRQAVVACGQVLGLFVLMLGMLRWYGLAYRVPELGRIGAYVGMALHTATALVLLGAGLFLARPRQGLAALLCNTGTTGMLGRRMTATILLLPPLMGWLRLTGQDHGWYGTRLGVALLVSAHVCVFLTVSFLSLRAARRVEVAHTRAQHRLTQSRWLQAFMDHVPAVVFIKDLEGRYTAVNAEFARSTGRPREEIVGRLAQDVLPPLFAQAARAADAEMLARGLALHKMDHLTLDERSVIYSTTLFPLPGPNGRPHAVCGISVDETAKTAARQQAERAHQRFRDLLESAPDAVLITDAEGTVVMANAQAEQLFGTPRGHLLGSPVEHLAPASHRLRLSALRRSYRQLGNGRPVTFDNDVWARHADGRVFPAEVSIGTLDGEAGHLTSLSVRDISRRKHLETELGERYREQQRIAYTLQNSLMGDPPRLAHLPTARRYLPSAQDAGVGGDWFDIIPLEKGRTGIVIGDVMGRGIDAAAVMGQLRAATHALAKADMDPEWLMNHLDAFVCELRDQLVTCCYLVLDPRQQQLTLCSAGHLPVLAAEPGRRPRPLDAPISVPLGVGGVPHRQITHPLALGATLMLYTDGLVEEPTADLDTRITLLADTLHTALTEADHTLGALEQTADLALHTLIPHPEEHDDDVTLLALRLPEARTTSLRLAPEPRSAPHARRFTTRTLHDWQLPPHLTDTAELVVTELVTNAIRHSDGAALFLTLHLTSTSLTVELADHSQALPLARQAGPTDENGRGLGLIDALSTNWGTRIHSQGKSVWSTMDTSPLITSA